MAAKIDSFYHSLKPEPFLKKLSVANGAEELFVRVGDAVNGALIGEKHARAPQKTRLLAKRVARLRSRRIWNAPYKSSANGASSAQTLLFSE